MDVKKKILNEDGQALFEFIFFLPIMITLLVLLLKIGNSINGAINQQKISRAYFFSKIKNNSMVPLVSEGHQQFDSIGMTYIGWAKELKNDQFPVQPCYKLNLPATGSANSEGECKEYSGDSTEYIRVGTVFGLCGVTLKKSGNSSFSKDPLLASGASGCLIQ